MPLASVFSHSTVGSGWFSLWPQSRPLCPLCSRLVVRIVSPLRGLDSSQSFIPSSHAEMLPALSPTTRGFDFGDVDFLHLHHRIKRALGLRAARGHRAGQNARSNLPGQSPAI